MRAIVGTSVFGVTAIALLIEVMNVALTFTALQQAARYNAWMGF
jgi:hypothetical protein